MSLLSIALHLYFGCGRIDGGCAVFELVCLDQDHHRLCGGKSQDHAALHRAGTGNFHQLRHRREGRALPRRADVGSEPRFRRNGSRLHGRHVRGGRCGAGQPSADSLVDLQHPHAYMAHPGIKRIEELRGKRFGIQNMGSSTWMHTMLALEYVGLDPKRDNINILSIGDSVLIGQALEAGRVDAAVLDGALVRRLRSKGFSTIAKLQSAKIPMLNQAVVVHPVFLQKRSETAERILMTLVESLAFSMAPANKSVVI